MAYLVIDTFLDKQEAKEKAKAYEKAGREKVTLTSFNGITVNDCNCFPCEAKYILDGTPVYVVMAEG